MDYPPYADMPKDAPTMERPQANGRSNAHATTPIEIDQLTYKLRMHA